MFLRLVNCVLQLAKRLFTANYISQVRLTQLCREAYLFHYCCVLCLGFYVRELSLRHLYVKYVLIINLRLCLSRKLQLTVYRSLFAYEKSVSVQKVTFPFFFDVEYIYGFVMLGGL